MKTNPILLALALVSFAGTATSQEKSISNTEPWIDLSAYADDYGNAAGNDLANEVVSRLHQSGVAYDAERTRSLCKKAVSDLLSERTLIPFRAFTEDKKTLVAIGAPITRRLTLELPEGFKWDEDVVIRFKADPANSRAGDPHLHDKMFVWVEFDLRDQISGKATMTVSGAASLRAEKKAEQGGTGQPATRPESKSEGIHKPQPDAEEHSR
jgi:hypothetical protein